MNIKDFTECFCGCKIILNTRDTSHFICSECLNLLVTINTKTKDIISVCYSMKDGVEYVACDYAKANIAFEDKCTIEKYELFSNTESKEMPCLEEAIALLRSTIKYYCLE